MTAREAKAMRITGRLKVLVGTPMMPPNWSLPRQRRMLKAVTLTLRYIRTKKYGWEETAKDLANWKDWRHPNSNDGNSVSHQYVSQTFSAGLTYLLDHAWLIDKENGEPFVRGPKKARSAA